ncbi:MAG: carboxypeptidase regulatory-like domain-containing protein [Pyrinomonadaceae bacterium]
MNTAPQLARLRARLVHPHAAGPLLLLACTLLTLSPYSASAQQRTRSNQTDQRTEAEQKPPREAKLRGRVVYDDTGRAVRRARVLLLADMSTEESGPAAVISNARGEFVFEHVQAGTYYVVVEGPGLLTPYSFLNVEDTLDNQIDFNAFRGQFEQVTVDGSGGNVEVQVRARRGAAITGKVTYENGDAAINVTVSLLRWQKGRLRQYLGGIGSGPAGTTETDDRGVYRFAGLPPGDYLVSVVEQIVHGDSSDDGSGEYDGDGAGPSRQSTPLVVTYYPSATRPADAETIKLVASEEHASADITLVERGLYTIAGLVKDRRTERPVPEVRLSIHLKESEAEEMPLTIDHFTQTDEQGHWAFNELPDGLYVLSVQPQPETDMAASLAYATAMRAAVDAHDENARRALRPPEPVQRLAAKRQEITIKGHDLPGLTIELSAGAHISGNVVVEGDKELPPYLSLYAEIASDAQHAAATGPSASLQNGRFVFGGIQPGRVYIHVNPAGNDESYYVKSISAGGTTYTHEPLTVEEGTVLKGVRVVLATDMATVHVRVVGATQEHTPVRGATVVLVPADARQWHSFALQEYMRTDAAGVAELSAPPGDYLLFLMPPEERPRSLSAEEVRRFSAGARHVTLRASKTEQVELNAPTY